MTETRRGQSHVLIVTSSLDVGGTERHLAAVTSRLVARGWGVTVSCISARGALAPEFEAAGVQVVGPPIEVVRGVTRRPKRVVCSALAAAQLSRLIGRLKPDIAHFFLADAYLAGGPLSVLRNVPVRIMSRRSLRNYQEKWPGAARLERMLHPQMTAVIANSRAIVRELRDEEGCSEKQLGLIYNGVELERFGAGSDRAQERAALGLPEDALVAVMIANLSAYKGHSDLVAALGRARGELKQPWLVLCAGEDRGRLAMLEQEAARLGIAGKVHFLGPIRDVAGLLAAADIGILCSHEEGFSNAVLESMAAHLPMVVTDVGGNSEAVVDGVTGIVVPPRSPEALAGAIVKLAHDKELRRSYGAAGRARVSSQFAMSACVDRYEALYRGLLAGQPVSSINGVAVEW